jgi:hypothetical protein
MNRSNLSFFHLLFGNETMPQRRFFFYFKACVISPGEATFAATIQANRRGASMAPNAMM